MCPSREPGLTGHGRPYAAGFCRLGAGRGRSGIRSSNQENTSLCCWPKNRWAAVVPSRRLTMKLWITVSAFNRRSLTRLCPWCCNDNRPLRPSTHELDLWNSPAVCRATSSRALPLLGENQEDFGLVCGGVLAKNSKKET